MALLSIIFILEEEILKGRRYVSSTAKAPVCSSPSPIKPLSFTETVSDVVFPTGIVTSALEKSIYFEGRSPSEVPCFSLYVAIRLSSIDTVAAETFLNWMTGEHASALIAYYGVTKYGGSLFTLDSGYRAAA